MELREWSWSLESGEFQKDVMNDFMSKILWVKFTVTVMCITTTVYKLQNYNLCSDLHWLLLLSFETESDEWEWDLFLCIDEWENEEKTFLHLK